MPPSTYLEPFSVTIFSNSIEVSGETALQSTNTFAFPAKSFATSNAPCGGTIDRITSLCSAISSRFETAVSPAA